MQKPAAQEGHGEERARSLCAGGERAVPASCVVTAAGVRDVAPVSRNGIGAEVRDVAPVSRNGIAAGVRDVAPVSRNGIGAGVRDVAPVSRNGIGAGVRDVAPVSRNGIGAGVRDVAPVSRNGIGAGVREGVPVFVRGFVLGLALVVTTLVGCDVRADRGGQGASAAGASATPGAASSAGGPTLDSPSSAAAPALADRDVVAQAGASPAAEASAGGSLTPVLTPGPVVAIGDTHGDLAGLVGALRLGGLVDADSRWVGGARHAVIVGDVLDRGDDEVAMVRLVRRLRVEAREAGGALHMVLGNHEVMNALGDFRYVTEGGWAGWPEEGVDALPADVPAWARARVAAFRPGGPEARWLAELPIFLQVNDSLFVHGGLLSHHVDAGLDRINREVAAWLRGQGPLPQRWVASDDSPLWTRVWSATDTPDCAAIGALLDRVGVRRIVVGHTVQAQGANGVCDGRVWRIDTGIARYYGGTVQAIEIAETGVRVLTP